MVYLLRKKKNKKKKDVKNGNTLMEKNGKL